MCSAYDKHNYKHREQQKMCMDEVVNGYGITLSPGQPIWYLELLTQYFKNRAQFERMYEFVQEHPDFLPAFNEEVQLGIDDLNHLPQYKMCVEMTPNAIQLRTILHAPLNPRQLPPFGNIFDSTLPETRATVSLMNQWMERGEAGVKEQPFIGWHHRRRTISACALTAGWLMDTYGVYAALTLLGYTDPPATHAEQLVIKDGTAGKGGGSETIMPSIEEVIGLKKRTQGYSLVLESITPWLKMRYKFSPSYLRMMVDDFNLELPPNAFLDS